MSNLPLEWVIAVGCVAPFAAVLAAFVGRKIWRRLRSLVVWAVTWLVASCVAVACDVSLSVRFGVVRPSLNSDDMEMLFTGLGIMWAITLIALGIGFVLLVDAIADHFKQGRTDDGLNDSAAPHQSDELAQRRRERQAHGDDD